MTVHRSLALLAVTPFFLLGACGDDETTPGAVGPPSVEAPALGPLTVDQLPGAYVMDLARTLRGDEPALGANPAPAPKEGDYRLDLMEGGRFTLKMGSGEFAFVLEGTWEAEDKTIRIRTTTVNGEPADEETSVEETMILEGRRLVLEQGGKRTYLRRLEEGPLAD